MEICSRFTGMERKNGAFLLHTDNADIKVCFVTDEIVRVRASFDHELAEESYVLMTTAWEDRMDELFKGERTRVEPFAAQVTEDDSTLTFATGKVTLVVDKDHQLQAAGCRWFRAVQHPARQPLRQGRQQPRGGLQPDEGGRLLLRLW